jgi:polar amino acid transport system ATP-binding protein
MSPPQSARATTPASFMSLGTAQPTRRRLEQLSRILLATLRKNAHPHELGGRAWRGYFPLNGELTSGIPDDKEGLILAPN